MRCSHLSNTVRKAVNDHSGKDRHYLHWPLVSPGFCKYSLLKDSIKEPNQTHWVIKMIRRKGVKGEGTGGKSGEQERTEEGNWGGWDQTLCMSRVKVPLFLPDYFLTGKLEDELASCQSWKEANFRRSFSKSLKGVASSWTQCDFR